MKRWFKLNYKYYLVYFIILVTIMIINVFEYNTLWLNGLLQQGNIDFYRKTSMVLEQISGARDQFLKFYPELFILGFIILHGVMLWGERNKCEREFLETLPVNRQTVIMYRAVADIGMLVISVIIAVIVTFFHIKSGMLECGIELPWLLDALIGIGITLICYTVMILGVMYFIESLVVRGDLKVITTAACMAMVYVNMRQIEILANNNIFNSLVGYIKLYAVGGNSYYIEKISHYTNFFWIPENKLIFPVIYDGKEFEFDTTLGSGYYPMSYGIANFKEADLYIWYALSYIAIGAILIGLGVYLTKKQDLSKQGFYFRFASILVGLLIFITIFSVLFVVIPEMWYSCIIAGLLGFAVFIYLTNRIKTGI